MLSLPELTRSVRLLEPLVVGRRAQRFIQPDDDTMQIELFGYDQAAGESTKLWLALSPHAKHGRLALTDHGEAPPWPPDFAALLKARLHRARVTGLRVVDDDRVVSMMLEGKAGVFELLLMLMGPRSNLLLLDADGKLVGSLKPVPLKPGEVWQPPSRPGTKPPAHDRWAEVPDAGFLPAVQAHYLDEARRAAADRLKDRVARALRKEAEFLERRSAKLVKDLEDAKEAREQKRHGELLKQVMSTIAKGDTHVLVRDFETNEDVQVKLDPQLTPAENMERYFKKYHKGLVGTNMLGQQLDITRSYLSDVRALQVELEGTEDAAAMAERPAVAELLSKHCPEEKPKRPPKKTPVKKDVPGRMLPRRYRTTDGLEIWVGKSDAGNDYLTTQLAAGNDWFFHVQGYPGSHTVLRTGGRKDPPQESVLEAAELCAHFSKLKDANKLDVHVAPIKYVSKPKNAKPGLVMVSQGKSIGLRRDPARLKRILEAQIKD